SPPKRALDGVAAAPERAARQPAKVEPPPPRVWAQSAGATQRPRRRRLLERPRRPGELLGRHRREVLLAQHLMDAPPHLRWLGSGPLVLAVCVGARLLLRSSDALGRLRPAVGRSRGNAQEPGGERPVEAA